MFRDKMPFLPVIALVVLAGALTAQVSNLAEELMTKSNKKTNEQ